jgi:predicted DNA-binding transcriptional regulator AlpA
MCVCPAAFFIPAIVEPATDWRIVMQTESTGLTLWSATELADILGVPVSTVNLWRTQGTGPKFIRVGKHVRYAFDDVVAWTNEHKHDRTW